MVAVTGWGVDLTYKSYNIYISTSAFPGPFQSDQGSSPEAQVFTAILRGLESFVVFVIIAGHLRPQITMVFGWVEMDPQIVEKNAEKTPPKTKMLEKPTFPMSS